MIIEVLDDADAVALRAAAFIAAEARAAFTARRRFIMAVSGGKTPWVMLRALRLYGPEVRSNPREAANLVSHADSGLCKRT